MRLSIVNSQQIFRKIFQINFKLNYKAFNSLIIFRCKLRLKDVSNLVSVKSLKLSEAQRDLINMQIDNAGRSEHGQRFTNSQKAFGLALYHKSKKAYTYLRSLITLPSPRTLRRYSKNMTLQTGINKNLMSHIRDTVENMSDKKEAVCELIWDEFHIQPHVWYDKSKDEIIGFEDFGDKRSSKFVDEVLVFMIRGLQSGWKMPISYYFCNNGTNWEQLTCCIKENVKAVKDSRLNLILTICDQGSSNIKSLKELRRQYEAECTRKDIPPGTYNFI